MKESEEDTNKRKYILCSWTGKLILLKRPYYPNQLQIQCNPYQNSKGISHRNRKNNPKIYMEPQKTPNSQTNLEKEEQSWMHHTP